MDFGLFLKFRDETIIIIACILLIAKIRGIVVYIQKFKKKRKVVPYDGEESKIVKDESDNKEMVKQSQNLLNLEIGPNMKNKQKSLKPKDSKKLEIYTKYRKISSESTTADSATRNHHSNSPPQNTHDSPNPKPLAQDPCLASLKLSTPIPTRHRTNAASTAGQQSLPAGIKCHPLQRAMYMEILAFKRPNQDS